MPAAWGDLKMFPLYSLSAIRSFWLKMSSRDSHPRNRSRSIFRVTPPHAAIDLRGMLIIEDRLAINVYTCTSLFLGQEQC